MICCKNVVDVAPLLNICLNKVNNNIFFLGLWLVSEKTKKEKEKIVKAILIVASTSTCFKPKHKPTIFLFLWATKLTWRSYTYYMSENDTRDWYCDILLFLTMWYTKLSVECEESILFFLLHQSVIESTYQKIKKMGV